MIRSGVDIVEVARLKEVVEKWGNKFLSKVFTQDEIAYSNQKRFPYHHLASRFAAKEAVFKALSDSKDILPLRFKDIEILNYDNGKPYVKFAEEAVSLVGDKRLMDVSLSHTKNYAIAYAIVVDDEIK